MRLTYVDELSRLEETYRRALHLDVGALAELHSAGAGQPVLFVASGGALAVAQVAADQHLGAYGDAALAITPLALVGEATVRKAAVVVISARAAHPDVAFALRAARSRHNYPISLVTHRPIEDLDPHLLDKLTYAVHVPNSGRDGFLATNSVLSLATLFVRAAHPEVQLPFVLPHLTSELPALDATRCLVLHGPTQRAAAIDLETRLSETGLAATQVSDYRNFAHGRHTGLARNLSDTAIVAFASRESQPLASATLNLLPPEARVVRLFSEHAAPAASLDLLVASMRIVGTTALAAGIDPARPKVPPWGRRLYHLRAQRHLAIESNEPVDRKLAAVGARHSSVLRSRYSAALDAWLAALAAVRFQAVVIDYDGTVCSTQGRFELPTDDVQQELLRLLDGGLHLGFATGRGKSLHADLRRWVPSNHWSKITLGLYNGALVIDGLDRAVPTPGDRTADLGELAHRLDAQPLADMVKIEVRPWQLSVEPVTGAGIGVETISRWVTENVAAAPHLAVKLVRSGHSVDVVDEATTKTVVLEHLEERVGHCLAVGDRGEVGGNDFELLAARPWTLSVDRCSGDETRCWNLAPPGVSGPGGLVRALRRLRLRRDGWQFRTDSR